MDLLKNESIIKDVIQVAQGEMALEEFLKQVKETWQTYELEMVNYQNKCRLIRGWDDLFNKVCTFKYLKLGLHFSEKFGTSPFASADFDCSTTKKSTFSLRDHSSITSSKRWVGGVRKWQFVTIYSTVNHQKVR